MSASLVGSEMCIRDSGDPVAGGQIDLISVSYTHLTLPTNSRV
ncbi:hypothetical protein JMUB7549_27690 [Staphylococcus aureus]